MFILAGMPIHNSMILNKFLKKNNHGTIFAFSPDN
jgi:hypothetical protein